MSVPNLISAGRLLAAPATLWLILVGAWPIAFALFVLASLSDALDGAIARRFDRRTPLGAYLDPIADKALIASVYLVLMVQGLLPVWLIVVIVARDVAVALGHLAVRRLGPLEARAPSRLGKLNTGAQMLLATVVLASESFGWVAVEANLTAVHWFVAGTALASAAGYAMRGQAILATARRTPGR